MADKQLTYTLSLKDLMSGKMAKAVAQTKKLDNSMNGIGNKLKSLAVGFGIGALATGILTTGASFERAEIQLKTLLKSADAAKVVFNDLKNEATKSPFGFETLLQGNAALISTGLSAKAAKEDFNGLANAVAATGGTEDTLQRMVFNLQQIRNVGKASGVDIKQFGMAGINIYQLLNDYYKKNHISLSKQKGDYAEITGALKLAAQEGGKYFGALDNLANSTSGRLSNLKDSAMNFAYDLFNSLKPAINLVVVGLTSLMDITKKMLPLIKIAVTLWGAYYIKLKISRIESFNFALAQRAMAMGMSKSAIATGLLSRGIRGIGAAIKAVPIIGWVAALVEGVMYLWDTFEGFRGAVYGLLESFKQMFSGLANAFGGMWKQIKGTLTGDGSLIKEGIAQELKAYAKSGGAYQAGNKKGISNFRKENGLGGGNASAEAMNAAGGAGANGSGSLGSGTEISSAKPTSIIINLPNGLIQNFTVATTNIKEGAAATRDETLRRLLELLSDSKLMQLANT